MHEQEELHDEFPSELSSVDENIRRQRSGANDFGPRPFRWRLWALAAVVAFFLVGLPAWSTVYTDWLWFQELRYQAVFSTVLTTKLLTGLVGGLIAALLFWLNLKIALKLSSKAGEAGYRFNIANQEIAVADLGNVIAKLGIPLSIVIGAFLGARSWNAWDLFLQYRYGVSFGQSDPVFGYDIGFYFFKLPLLEFVLSIILTLTVFALIAAVVIYVGRAAIGISGARAGGFPSFSIQRGARGHLLFIVALLFLMLAANIYLDLPNLLLANDGVVSGAGYTDLNATVPLMWAQISVAMLISLLAIAGIFLSSFRYVLVGIALFALVLIAGFIYPSVVQKFSVAPNELAKESPFIANSIAATRQAFNLDQVEERELSGDATLTAKDIQDNRRTINGIRLWDQKPLLDTFAQLQEIRPYYEFQGVDNDRYKINGEMQQVMLSVRELESNKLPNRNWINERLIFTHGYGLTLGPVNQITPEGLPSLYVKDIPPVTTIPSLKIDRPEIYFGEMANEQVFVKTKQEEFNYPEGEKNQFSTYTGTGGVEINSYWRKLFFSTRFADLKLMLSNDITSESRVLFYRNIRERLQMIAPYLKFDHDPYLVISEGKCFWMCDAYTVSNRYPYAKVYYSQEFGAVNYLRNSVKAVIDAYNGSVQLYIADDKDPLIQTYARIFPGTLKPLKEMPADLQAHIRYPEDIFNFQTQVYSTYHMDQPQVFYNKEDQWDIASAEERDGKAVAMEPYYTIMKLPEAKSEEFLVMLPFVPRNKLNLASWMVARCDPENYGKLVVYRIPKQKQIFGPKQIIGRINQDAEISGQLTLWNQKGSKVIFGTMLVIPVKESLLYVQPLYLQSDTGKIPELKRVIVVNENKIAMSETLDGSLTKLFGNGAAPAQPGQETQSAIPSQPPTAIAPNQIGLIDQALQHDDLAMKALRDSDWAKYGEERKKVRALLDELKRGK